MTFELVIFPKAEEDIESAYLWYEDKRLGLGHDFLLNLEAGFEIILRDPFIFKEEYKSTRKHLIKRFPFKIIYIIEDSKVIVLAVLHERRNPDLINNRI